MITYTKRRKWKYTLNQGKFFETGILNFGSDVKFAKGVVKRFPVIPDPKQILAISSEGTLCVNKGYAWDGPSGPARDTVRMMTPSLKHDALYQLMREGVLPQSARQRADEIFRDDCIKNGVPKIKAWTAFHILRNFGAKSAKPNVLTAP